MLKFRLSETARVTVAFERRTVGRRVKRNGKRRCVRPRRARRRARRCARHVKAGALTVRGKPGRNRKRFLGRVGGRLLKPGAYRVSLTAVDVHGAESRTVTRRVRVLRP